MKRIILCLIICLPFFLQSCGKERIILKYKPTKLTAKEKARRSDEVKVVEVVDKRLYQNNVIGTTLTGIQDKRTPVILKEPLDEIVKDGLNRYMSDSVLADNFTPVRVEIHDFEASVDYSMWGYVPYNKYSFLFSYTKNNKERSFYLKDSSNARISAFNSAYSRIIDNGLSRAAELFLIYYKTKSKSEPDIDVSDLQSVESTLFDKKKNIDTLDYKVYTPDSRRWITLQFLSGEYSKKNYRLAYEQVFRKKKSNWGYGYEAFFEINNPPSNSEYIVESYSNYGIAAFLRYNLDPVHFSISINAISGSETIDQSPNFIFGLKSTQQIGIEISDIIRIGGGLYEMAILNSKVYPKDYGWLLTLGIGF